MDNSKQTCTKSSQNHWYLHVDLDAFFASVEQLDNPEYRGKPVIVGGRPEDKRSVVSTASYEARKFGVHSAMPIFQAYKLCPSGIFVRGRMKRYAEISCIIMDIFKDFSPDVQQMSIDEAFIDLTGTEKLFGSPEETAQKIKRKVKEITGLTVSVGLATSKYLAKIASGYSKPDGFYFVKPGSEKDFMLNLPLKKVWGLGPKTLEILRGHGITSTIQIYNISKENLELLFGKSMGLFLYNSVRGLEAETFSNEKKSHSISSETTFLEDIREPYIAETEILNLAQAVFFRLLKEGGYSKTAFIKIKYSDFSTVSARQTEENDIMTLDTFYEILKFLFEKKFDYQKGIRLLGVGFENIKKQSESQQLSLFEDKEQKKSDVEKAILSFTKKHPDVKIQKARTLKTKVLVFFALTLFFSKNLKNLYAQEIFSEESFSIEKSSTESSSNVDFFLQGFWLGEISSSIYARKETDKALEFSPQNPVFTQKVDLSAHLLLDEKYFFNGEFSDEFKDSLLEIGYRGKKNIKEVKLANKGISFPDNYATAKNSYTSYGGNNFSPGIKAHVASSSNKIQSDFAANYEASEAKSQVFYGMNKVLTSYLELNQFIYGCEFLFPYGSENFLGEIKDIYVQNDFGTFFDENGNSYKKISSKEFLVIQSQRKISLFAEAKAGAIDKSIPKVIITFYDDSVPEQIFSLSGSYGDSSSFMGKIQSQFKDGINLEDFSYNLKIKINGEKGLLIQNDKGFSPYLCQNIYLSKEDAKVFVMDSSTKIQNLSYEALPSFLENSFVEEDFFKSLKYYTKIVDKASNQNECPEYPFGKSFPETYLQKDYNTKLVICIEELKGVQNFFIGNTATKDSVRVFINGIQDFYAVYSKESGIVSPSKSICDTDKIYITYTEDSSDFSSGFFTLQGGIIFFPSENFNFNISLAGQVPTDEEKSLWTALGSGINFENKGFTFNDSLTTAVEKNDESNNFSTQNSADLLFQKEEFEIINDSFIIKDLLLHATSNQNLTTSKIFLEKADYNFSMRNTADGKVTLSKITTSGNITFSESEYLSAGHGIKSLEPIFSLFSFEENFQHNKNEKNISKSDEAKINFSKPSSTLNFLLKAKSTDSVVDTMENQKSLFTFNFSLFPSSPFTFSFFSEADFSSQKKNDFFEDASYFDSYKQAGKNQISSGFETALLKKENYSLTLCQNLKKIFTPKITYNLSAEDSSYFDNYFSDFEKIGLELPLLKENSTFTFSLLRTARAKEENYQILNYFEGSKKLLSLQNNRQYFYTSLPFYELFENDKSKKLEEDNSSLYSAKYSLDFKRKLFYTHKDILLPYQANLSFTRDTSYKSDIYQLKNYLNYKTLSLFPKLNDESSFGSEAAIKFPYGGGEILSYKFSIFSSTFFFLENGNTLNFFLQGNLQTDLYWDATSNISYSRKGKTSLTKALISYFSKNETSFFITRKDSLSLSFGNDKKIFHQKYDIKHYCETKFQKNFATTSLINTIFTISQENKMTAFLSLTLGGKMEF